MKKYFGFTLAETLITMTMIGILASLMMISLNNANPDKDKVMFLKSYHTLELAIADIMRDGTKYDQNAYSNSDFSTAPLPTAKSAYGTPTQNNALCLFVAEQMNVIGTPNCSSDGLSFQASNGACFHNMNGAVSASSGKDIIIKPRCEKSKESYKVRIFADGRMTVPSDSKAYNWMLDQLKLQ